MGRPVGPGGLFFWRFRKNRIMIRDRVVNNSKI